MVRRISQLRNLRPRPQQSASANPPVKQNAVFIDGMHGIGDNINQRCFIKTLSEQGKTVYLKTPLPEIYSDIPGVKFVKADSTLRTQARNEKQTQATFVRVPAGVPRKRIFYGNSHMQRGSLFDAMASQFGVTPAWLDLPQFQLPDLNLPAGKPVALIRPTTERREWHNASRGPLNKYIDQAARLLSARGYYIISVADLVHDVEWIPGMEPYADLHLHHGELTIPQLLALVERSDIVVTGVCVIFHAALAYNRPMICIQGGNGGNNHHHKTTCSSCMSLSRTIFVYPDNYCRCQEMKHNCDKTITDLEGKITPFIEQVSRTI